MLKEFCNKHRFFRGAKNLTIRPYDLSQDLREVDVGNAGNSASKMFQTEYENGATETKLSNISTIMKMLKPLESPTEGMFLKVCRVHVRIYCSEMYSKYRNR